MVWHGFLEKPLTGNFLVGVTYLEAEPVLAGEGVHGLLLETLLAL